MTMFYAKLTNGFYDAEIHGDAIPADAVAITADEHAALLTGQSSGLRIVGDDAGRPVLSAPIPPSAKQIKEALLAAVQAHLDAAAAAAGYDNIFTACTYADEAAVPKFRAEGRALRAWRSSVWSACHGIMDEVKAGTRQAPTASELIGALPVLAMP